MMFRRLCISRNVEAASHSPYETLIGGKPQVLARYSSAIKVARSEDTRPTDHPGYKVCLRDCHWIILQYVGRYVQVPTYRARPKTLRYLPCARCQWWSQPHHVHSYLMSITNGQTKIADSRLEQYYDLTKISFGVRFLTLATEKFDGSTGATGVLIS